MRTIFSNAKCPSLCEINGIKAITTDAVMCN